MPLTLTRPRAAALLTGALALASLAAPATSPAHADTTDPAPTPAIALKMPAKQTVEGYRRKGRQQVPLDLRVVAQGAPFEIWSSRASYDDPITSVYRGPDGDVTLPAGITTSFTGLSHFFRIHVHEVGGGTSFTTYRPACLDTYDTQRVRPDAPAYSPYPTYCGANPYSVGGVQGVQAGWAASVLGYDNPLSLEAGTYDITVAVQPGYAHAIGQPVPVRSRVVVKAYQGGNGGNGGGPVVITPGHGHGRTSAATAPSQRPTGAAGRVDGPVPDLEALPAWGIQVAPHGNYLQFSATVWNAGDSPLVVDGFRRDGEDEMDAYQYFFDADGNQTGYVPVGGMHWDPRPTHQHWHFEDFATYTLLDADKQTAVKSQKEAFCLANTDAVDLTVPAANWKPDNTDLATACGDYDSLSVREVLATGWGDTYAQFRAGQSFDLRGLKNGTYYIEVKANPYDRLTEASLDNNVSLRKVVIGGKPGARTVKVPQVGMVVEPPLYGGGGGVHPIPDRS